MEGTKPPTFCPTQFDAWPAEPPDLPAIVKEDLRYDPDNDQLENSQHRNPPSPLERAFGEELMIASGRQAELLPLDSEGESLVQIPEDFCFRECLEVDPDDHPAVAGFVLEWGRLSPVGCPKDTHPLASLRDVDGHVGLIRDLGRRLRVSDITADSMKHGFPLLLESHYLHRLRALARHYLAFRRGEPVADAWLDEGFACPSEQDAWRLWVTSINAAMRPFTFEIRLMSASHQMAMPVGTASTYEVAVLQLMKIATAGRSVSICANERCGQTFTRQRGVAQYRDSGHNTGVIYCSRTCAKAQAERRRRARRRAERDQGDADA